MTLRTRTSRRSVAKYLGARLASDRRGCIAEAAAWLVSTGRSRDGKYLAMDIARVAEASGYCYARIISARRLSLGDVQRVEAYLKRVTGAKTIELEMTVDETLIGGIKIETGGATLDDSLRARLARITAGASA